MIVTRDEMLEIERAALDRGRSARGLMEEAGKKLAALVQQFHPAPGLVVAYCGKGHNAGDALVALRRLKEHGWRTAARLAFDAPTLAELTASQLQSWGGPILNGSLEPELPLSHELVLLDGLVGLGSRGDLEGPLAHLAAEMNTLRTAGLARVVSVDLPSGLDPVTGDPGQTCVTADLTAAIGCVKTALCADAAINQIGRLAVLSLPDLSPTSAEREAVLTSTLLAPQWPVRAFDTNKAMCGRIGIMAGSPETPGAARMCCEGALLAGGGLITLFCDQPTAARIAPSLRPEIMIRVLHRCEEILDHECDVIAMGPGMGHLHDQAMLKIIAEATCPMVVDADGLNALARSMRTPLGQSKAPTLTALGRAKGPRLLTPHPGEMRRLLGVANLGKRSMVARAFTTKHPCTLLLKGARTVVAQAKHPLRYNTTGHPGMATGGMGDVLTGVCAALAGQGADLYNAACLGAWMCGRAAELAMHSSRCSPESLTPSDVLSGLGRAFASLRAREF